MSERVPAIRVLLLPKDTNAYGTIFGGVILANIDLASAIEARKVAAHRFVTKAMREVEFHEPVYVGDIVDFYTHTVRDRPDVGDCPCRGRGRAMGKSPSDRRHDRAWRAGEGDGSGSGARGRG